MFHENYQCSQMWLACVKQATQNLKMVCRDFVAQLLLVGCHSHSQYSLLKESACKRQIGFINYTSSRLCRKRQQLKYNGRCSYDSFLAKQNNITFNCRNIMYERLIFLNYLFIRKELLGPSGQHAKYLEAMVHPYCTTRAHGSVIQVTNSMAPL